MLGRISLILLVSVALLGFTYYLNVNVIRFASALNPYNEAIGQLSRAESAQIPDELIYHVTIAKQQLPESGSVLWWSPQKGDFKSIQAQLDDIINRARNISALELGNELFNSEMYAIHAKLEGIQKMLVLP